MAKIKGIIKGLVLGIAISFVLLVLIDLANSAEIYRSYSSKGTVVFSDQGGNEVMKVTDTEKTEVRIDKQGNVEKSTTREIKVEENSVHKYLKEYDKKLERRNWLKKNIERLEEELDIVKTKLKDMEWNRNVVTGRFRSFEMELKWSSLLGEKQGLETVIRGYEFELSKIKL